MPQEKNLRAVSFAIFLLVHQEGAAYKVSGIENRHWFPWTFVLIIRRFNDGGDFLPTKEINTLVMILFGKCRAHIRPVDYLLGVISENFVGHGVTHILGDANPATTSFGTA